MTIAIQSGSRTMAAHIVCDVFKIKPAELRRICNYLGNIGERGSRGALLFNSDDCDKIAAYLASR